MSYVCKYFDVHYVDWLKAEVENVEERTWILQANVMRLFESEVFHIFEGN